MLGAQSERSNLSKSILAWLNHLPGALIVCVIAPLILAGGAAEMVATVLTVLITSFLGIAYSEQSSGLEPFG